MLLGGGVAEQPHRTSDAGRRRYGNCYIEYVDVTRRSIAAPNDTRAQPLGDGGRRLHQWLGDLRNAGDRAVLDELVQETGATVMGRRSYDLCAGDGGWGDSGPLGSTPCFVLTHSAPQECPAPAVFTFVTDGIQSAVRQAKAAAGDRNVGPHGASAARQCLQAGLVDELQVHLIPVLLGAGIRLFDNLDPRIFELKRNRVVSSGETTHLRFAVAPEPKAEPTKDQGARK